MENYYLRIIQTLIVVGIYISLYFLKRGFLNKFIRQIHLTPLRKALIGKIVNIFNSIIAIVFIAGIWGVDQADIAVFISSVLTVVGVAFFAQWSILSNITSGLVLFFNHPLKLGDTIKIMDKEFPFEGEIEDLTYFFVFIKTSNGEVLTIPNSVLLQKPIVIVSSSEI